MKDMETRMDEDGDERKQREKGHDDKERVRKGRQTM